MVSFSWWRRLLKFWWLEKWGTSWRWGLLVMSDQFPYLCWLSFAFFHLGGNRKCNLLNGCVMWDAGRVLEFVSYYFEDVQSEVAWGSLREEERFLGLIFPSSCTLAFPFLVETPLRLFNWLIFYQGRWWSVFKALTKR